MTEASAFLDIVKNLLVICCLLATLASTCRQEQFADRINTQIISLEQAAVDFQQCAAWNGDNDNK